MVGGNPSVGGGGFAASPAGTAPLYYKSAEIASGSAKNLCKKSGDVGGCAFFAARLPCLYLLFCPPIPPTPFPSGEGGDQGYFMQGASPLASPGLNLRGTGSTCRCGKLNGGLAPALPAQRASAIPGGGLARLVACLPCLYLLFCPLSPHPPSPVGKGETKVISCKGLRPLHPRDLNPRGTGSTCRCGKLNGGLAPALPARRASAIPGGGLARLVARLPCLYLLFCPLSPCPLPRRGRGCPKVYFAGGFAPGTPAFNRLRHLQNLPSRYPAAEIRDCRKNDRKRFPMSSAGSQGEGGPGEMELSVASDGGV